MRLEDLTEEQKEKISEFGVNTWYVLDLFSEYKKDPSSVNKKWQDYFKAFDVNDLNELGYNATSGTNGATGTNGHGETNGQTAKKKTETPKASSGKGMQAPNIVMPKPTEDEEAVIIRGAGARVIDNMTTSLTIPTATTFRAIPVKLLEENRIIINQHLQRVQKGKISFTHIIGWAIIKGIKSVPVMNNAFTIIDGEPMLIKKEHVNLGLAIDLEKKDGTRSLIVPNIKKADTMNFREFFDAYNDIINRARANKIEVADFQGTTVSLTNPGTIGTNASSPRLMLGQGTIVATGAIEYPAEFHAAAEEVITSLGISKVMNMTSTYDHRIIQGAESGMFLKRIHEFLLGNENFYDEIFRDLQIPVLPVYWHNDKPASDGIDNLSEIEKQAKAIQMINMFRVRGHLLAQLDPLTDVVHSHPELDSSFYGFTIWDYDRKFITDGLAGMRTATLREILDILYKTYCDRIGVEYRHIQDPDEKLWLQNIMEPVRNTPKFPDELKKHILFKLMQSEFFEKYIDKRYLGHKRFSLEGSETIIALLDYLLTIAADDEVEEVMFGMAHRGRLNVLANIIGKSMEAIFSEFEGKYANPNPQGSGDVKYHLGATGEYQTFHGESIKVGIASNPSHLEFVNPVVEGIVRAKQTKLDDKERKKVIPILLHGDAAFAGQGIVAETLNLSQLRGYSTGGTIHIIINNQIGFTTAPVDARSTVYATDVAKMVQAPIFHVNGDDPEATVWVTDIAFKYRQKYKKDVVIDVFGYRRLGHNETDEPAYTQPLMYKAIKAHPSVLEIYKKRLINEKVITEDDYKQMEKDVVSHLDTNYEKAHNKSDELTVDAPLVMSDDEIEAIKNKISTKVSAEELNAVVETITVMPEKFTLHPKLKKFIDSRKDFLTNDKVIVDWAFAEALAFGTLINEGVSIRLSGQDSARGTFSQRHMVLTDVNTGDEIVLHENLKPGVKVEALDSLLSEQAVLGFEYGYSTADPTTLVMWEAQFGDFVNGAQVIIDNFIASSYSKWHLPSDVVLLLPHGQEGQGPEHSSARLERFLELCAGDNMFVCNPTTSAQYFHLLRRQAKDKVRKPLIIMTPKSLLREKMASSMKNEFVNEKFHRVLFDTELAADGKGKDVRKIILTSGKVYYDLLKYRTEHKINDVAIVRLEQYYPYPSEILKEEVFSVYKKAKVVAWVQEEPENFGALRFLALRLMKDISKNQTLELIARKESSSPAPGSKKLFDETQLKIMQDAFA